MKYWIYHYIDRYIGRPILFIFKFFDKILRIFKNKSYKIKKILLIKLTMMGDTILLYPAVKALRDTYGDCEIVVLCSKVNEKIIEQWDFIDRYIVFKFDYLFKNPLLIIWQIWNLYKERFDLAIDFEQWFRITPIIAYLTAKLKLGFKTPKQYRHYLFDITVPHVKKRHEVLCFCDLVEAIGVKVKDKDLYLKINEVSNKKIENFLKDNNLVEKQFVIIHPGCGVHGYYRQWDVEKYAEVAKFISTKYVLPIVITGSRDDIKIAKKLFDLVGDKCFNLSGKTDINDLIALVSKSKFVICGNTGVMHIAVALKVPTVAIHGPTDPEKWGPWGKNHIVIKPKVSCAPCSYLGFEYGCKERKCLKGIAIEEVIDNIKKLL